MRQDLKLFFLTFLGINAEKVVDQYRRFWDLGNGLTSRSTQYRLTGVYNRCKVQNGKVYGSTGKEHPKKIIIKCATGYSLVDDKTERKFYSQATCIRKSVHSPVKCLRDPPPAVKKPKWKAGCSQ